MGARIDGWLATMTAVVMLASASAAGAQGKPPGAKEQLEFGVEMAARGLWNEALFRFQRADRENPENPVVLNNMAVAYEALGQFDEALRHYQLALRLDPQNRSLKRNYARFAEFYQSYKRSRQEDADLPPADVPPAAKPSGGDDPSRRHA